MTVVFSYIKKEINYGRKCQSISILNSLYYAPNGLPVVKNSPSVPHATLLGQVFITLKLIVGPYRAETNTGLLLLHLYPSTQAQMFLLLVRLTTLLKLLQLVLKTLRTISQINLTQKIKIIRAHLRMWIVSLKFSFRSKMLELGLTMLVLN